MSRQGLLQLLPFQASILYGNVGHQALAAWVEELGL